MKYLINNNMCCVIECRPRIECSRLRPVIIFNANVKRHKLSRYVSTKNMKSTTDLTRYCALIHINML